MQSQIDNVFSNIDNYRSNLVSLPNNFTPIPNPLPQSTSNPAHNDFVKPTGRNNNFAFIDSLEKEVNNRSKQKTRIDSARREAGLNDLRNSQNYYDQIRKKQREEYTQ